MMTDTSDQAVPRISNLSQAKIFGPSETSSAAVGKTIYNAPEICKNEPYDHKVDSWSFGVIIYYILTGSFPYVYTNDVKTLQKAILSSKVST
mmetsp:Transcript_13803/g.9766  ORF Transcript_13803/g.9766 Transcript_13803/m.9766 type:complete len:92 (+) Transcript_13803:1767-2042(+)